MRLSLMYHAVPLVGIRLGKPCEVFSVQYVLTEMSPDHGLVSQNDVEYESHM